MEEVNQATAGKDTLNRRYFYKVGSNIITIFVGILTSAIVPRALGVRSYGDFSFVNNIITQFLTLLDMRASTSFYVKLSQRQSEPKIITFYGIYTILVFLFLSLVLGAMTVSTTRQFLFEGIDRRIVWFSFFFVGIKWIADIFIRISDAYGTTQAVEKIKIVNYILSTIVLVLLFYFDIINLSSFYLHQIATFSVFVFFVYAYFRKNGHPLPLKISMDRKYFKGYAREFFIYSSPLALYLVTSFVSEIFDRYILQQNGGSYQQGLYGFSFSVSSTVVLFVTAMVPLFTRELSIAFANENVSHASDLYRKYVPALYFVSSYFCCFLFANAESVLMIFGGEQYIESLVPLRILLLYPLVSTYSNLNGSVVYARGGNVLFRNIALVLHPLGMVAAYFLISSQFGNFGAIGLAIKVLALELISVFFIMHYISKFLKIKILKYFLHMIVVPTSLIFLALGIKYMMQVTFAEDTFLLFMTSGILYTMALALVLYFFPIFVGLSNESVRSIKKDLSSKFNSLLK